MKKIILCLLMMPGLSMAAVKVNFDMLLDQKEYSGECMVEDKGEFQYAYEDGVEVTGEATVDEQTVTFDITVLTEEKIIVGPYLAANMGERASVEMKDEEQNTFFAFAIEANYVEEDAHGNA